MHSAQNKSLIQLAGSSGDSSFRIDPFQWLVHPEGYETAQVEACDHFTIIWITKGSGECWIDLNRTAFGNNRVFFIKPGQMHRLQPIAQLEGYIISFTEPFVMTQSLETSFSYHDSILKMFLRPGGIKIDEGLAAEMQDFAEKMIREYTGNNLFREEMLRRYLKVLFIYFSRQIEGSLQVTHQTRNIELVEKFMELLDRHFRTEKMVSAYAGLLSVTPNYLNEIVKKTTGHSASHHIRQRIVLEAKLQATYSDSCMKQIGYYLGFDDTAHFSKFFKTAAGMNFTDFKKGKTIVSVAC